MDKIVQFKKKLELNWI